MSGVYIKGMKMPTEGNWVSLRFFSDGQCVLYSWCGNDFDFMERLTAVPVPEPHGRLIDADKLDTGKMIDVYIRGDLYRHEWNIDEWLNSAPTIIPASEED